MDPLIQISKINDFLFCPRSLYFHSIYEGYDQSTYHSKDQTAGSRAHDRIESGQYSSSKRYVSGIPVASETYGLTGKIDIYDAEAKVLIERKRELKKLHLGHKYQLYAQMLCMREMGYVVDGLKIHSLVDNRNYDIPLPQPEEWGEFLKVIETMQTADPASFPLQENLAKCRGCIYRPLCRNDIPDL